MEKLVINQTKEQALAMVSIAKDLILDKARQDLENGYTREPMHYSLAVDNDLNLYIFSGVPSTDYRFILLGISDTTDIENISFPDTVFDPDSICDVEIEFAPSNV
jgi:hypothetical protein